MAIDEPVQRDSTSIMNDVESDYGSDLDTTTWDDLSSQAQSQQPVPTIKVEDIEEAVIPQDAPEPQPHSLRLARIRQNLEAAISGLDEIARHTPQRSRATEIEYDESNRESFTSVMVGQDEQEQREPSPAVEERGKPDLRTPIQRFRKPPKKTLSVTDIVSPAWCELQYWYSLTKYGRIRRTPAMKQGSKIHKEKEKEVYTEVPVQLVSQEDKLGLRLWNIIQGLRTLRSTGLTRELEVLGLVDGEVIIGIIDEISYTCPDKAMGESILEAAEAAKAAGKGRKAETIPADQRTMADFFGNSQGTGSFSGSARERPRSLYLVDIKTRKSKTLPKLGAQMRPTQMQLMMYRRLLNDLAANNVEADIIFERYRVDPQKPFSDTFIAELANLDLTASSQEGNHEDEIGIPVEDSLDLVLSHNSLSSLWAFMISEFAKTIQINAVSSSISPLLTAEFRTSDKGALIGRRSFAFEADVLQAYVQQVLRWWRGEREAQGVDIEEAYKCGICDFAETCTWRIGKMEEATKKARLRTSTRTRSQI